MTKNRPISIALTDRRRVLGFPLPRSARESSSTSWRASVFHEDIPAPLLAGPGTLIDEGVRRAAMLVEHGWLKRISADGDIPSYQFICRSARNFVRDQCSRKCLKEWAGDALARSSESQNGSLLTAGDAWELHRLASLYSGAPSAQQLWHSRRGIADSKLATYALLQAYRRGRAGGGENLALLASTICDGFAEIGSIRRRSAGPRWRSTTATAARCRHITERGAFPLRVHELSRKLPAQRATLTALLDGEGIADGHVRGYLLSELGTVELMQSVYDAASARYFEAHHLLEDTAPESAEYVRNLNRLGLVLMRIGHFAAARKHLERCRKLAQQSNFDVIARLALGNLVILERAMGDPQAAARASRRP